MLYNTYKDENINTSAPFPLPLLHLPIEWRLCVARANPEGTLPPEKK